MSEIDNKLQLESKITKSVDQKKNWRKIQKWYTNGKHNECEIYQKGLIKDITGYTLEKTNHRLNTTTGEMKCLKNPMCFIDGYEWTEDFDGIICKDSNVYYFNLKFICDRGGSQTRSLREVYHFIRYQLNYLTKNKYPTITIPVESGKNESNDTKRDNSNVIFVNILDGDTSHSAMPKYKFLLGKKQYTDIQENIFVGDMYTFVKYWKEHICS